MRAYLELIRLPNLFTAMADVMLGYLLTHSSLQPWWTFALLLGSSTLLYSAGMVLNDLFDLVVDMRQRPNRPLPSGRVRVRTAIRLGRVLLIGGVLLGWAASGANSLVLGQLQWRSAAVATLLAVAVVAYDKVLKRTPLAPAAMGACRFLNVLLGASAATAAADAAIWHPMIWVAAAGVGVYITGVTWFARKEADGSSRLQLGLSIPVMAAGIALLAWFPKWADQNLAEVSWPLYAEKLGFRWYFLWTVLGTLILWRCAWAVIEPSNARVQAAVKHCILSLVVLDAAACFAVRDIVWATTILLLVVPAMFLSRWVYST
jgi:4-hydroxybenzoate polyprenyltransferase